MKIDVLREKQCLCHPPRFCYPNWQHDLVVLTNDKTSKVMCILECQLIYVFLVEVVNSYKRLRLDIIGVNKTCLSWLQHFKVE